VFGGVVPELIDIDSRWIMLAPALTDKWYQVAGSCKIFVT